MRLDNAAGVSGRHALGIGNAPVAHERSGFPTHPLILLADHEFTAQADTAACMLVVGDIGLLLIQRQTAGDRSEVRNNRAVTEDIEFGGGSEGPAARSKPVGSAD